MNGLGWVKMELYLQKKIASQIWLMGNSLQTPALQNPLTHLSNLISNPFPAPLCSNNMSLLSDLQTSKLFSASGTLPQLFCLSGKFLPVLRFLLKYIKHIRKRAIKCVSLTHLLFLHHRATGL